MGEFCKRPMSYNLLALTLSNWLSSPGLLERRSRNRTIEGNGKEIKSKFAICIKKLNLRLIHLIHIKDGIRSRNSKKKFISTCLHCLQAQNRGRPPHLQDLLKHHDIPNSGFCWNLVKILFLPCLGRL